MLARAFVSLQHLLPQHTLSRLIYWLTRSEQRWLSRTLIRLFMRGFRPDLGDAVETRPLAYRSFNEFFTRALRPGTRPLPDDPLAIACPVDGTVSMAGAIDGQRLLQAKGHDYSLTALLAGHEDWVRRFSGGQFVTIYLAPYNYHRIHMPLAGTLQSAWYVPGRLFSVNATTAARVPGLFARNERLICAFDDPAGGFAMVLVGALFVGSMSTVWHGDVTPARQRVPRELQPLPGAAPLAAGRGAELGRFNMGSTVILLLPPGRGAWHTGLMPGRIVRVGEPIGRLLTHTGQ
jgi:phosphatidylserine decarboxylase